MRCKDALSISDLRALARRRLPKVLFDLIESGVEDDLGSERNRRAFRKFRIMPRCLLDVSQRDQQADLFGQRYNSPIGISPTGFLGLFRRGADLMLAEAAAETNIPIIASGAGTAPIEDIARIGGKKVWFQLYAAKDEAISQDLMRRAEGAGVEVLVLTVDTPLLPKRETDMRNGFRVPMRLTLPLIVDGITHPAWAFDYISNGGVPMMSNWEKYAPAGSGPPQIAAFFREQSPSIQTWESIAEFRRRWTGKLILKGIQNPNDARRALELGIDGIIVSNHGGKAVDALPATLEALPLVKKAVGSAIPVMIDGGIMRGSDAIIAKCLGADHVFVGRATLYGVAASGKSGAAKAISILMDEIDTTLGLIGCSSFRNLGEKDVVLATPQGFADWAARHA